MTRAGLVLLALLASTWASALAAPGAEARGDAAWADRADGFVEQGRPRPEPARAATEAYGQALRDDPSNLRLHFKLIEALYFQGSFVEESKKSRKRLFERMVDLAEESVALAESPSETARAHFWSAIAWGVWGMQHSRLAAAAKGVPARIRRHAEELIRIDRRYADAGGLRLLGRLHTVLPRVPWVSGWVDRQAGIALLEQAKAISQRDHRNLLFLAEALVKYAPERTPEAIELLRRLDRRAPAPEMRVEESETLAQARGLLHELEHEAKHR